QNAVYLNSGDGTFVASGNGFDTDDDATSTVGLGDVDGDGDLDLIAGHHTEDYQYSTKAYLNDGAGAFLASERSFQLLHGATHLSTGDLDGDGDVDVLWFGGIEGVGFGVATWLNADGDVRVTSSTPPLHAPRGVDEQITWEFQVENSGSALLTNVGVSDRFAASLSNVVLTETIVSPGAVSQLAAGPLAGSLEDQVNLAPGATVTYRLSATFRDDGSADATTIYHRLEAALPSGGVDFRPENNRLTGVNSTPPSVVWGGSGRFTEVAPIPDAFDQSMDVGDFNGDGIADLVGASTYYWLGDGNGGFAQAPRLATSGGRDATVGDFNGDGLDDIYVAGVFQAGQRLDWLFLGDGNGGLVDSGQRFPQSESAHVVDFDADGDLDLLLVRSTITLLENDGVGNFTTHATTIGNGNRQHTDVAFLDVDQDGDLDAIAATAGYGNPIWINEGDFTLSISPIQLGTVSASHVATGDVNSDGLIDVVLGGVVDGDVFLNRGAFSFVSIASNLEVYGGAVALGDVDADGDLDLLKGQGYFINDGEGGFTAGPQQFPNDGVKNLFLIDVNLDGSLDVVRSTGKVWVNGDAEVAVQASQPQPVIASGQAGPTEFDFRVVNLSSTPIDDVDVAFTLSANLTNINLLSVTPTIGVSHALAPGAITSGLVADRVALPVGGEIVYRFAAEASLPQGVFDAAWATATVATPDGVRESSLANNRAIVRNVSPIPSTVGSLPLFQDGGLPNIDTVSAMEIADFDNDG
ncbi:MAG: VCBS repeat-containing protein, partial [Planctomycetales bacterium]|nr:VCBS repeat-containing protein [Planctomycetales bacterium]